MKAIKQNQAVQANAGSLLTPSFWPNKKHLLFCILEFYEGY